MSSKPSCPSYAPMRCNIADSMRAVLFFGMIFSHSTWIREQTDALGYGQSFRSQSALRNEIGRSQKPFLQAYSSIGISGPFFTSAMGNSPYEWPACGSIK
eukprot:6563297-Pyramimonas_sp.AAC.1